MKKLKNTIDSFVSILRILALLFFMFVIIATVVKLTNLKNENSQLINALQNKKVEFGIIVNSLGDTIAIQKQTIVSQKAAIESGLIDREELRANNIKHLQTIVKAEERITNLQQIIAGWVNIDDNIVENPDSIDLEQYIKVPRAFSYKDEWMKIMGLVDKQGVIFSQNDIEIISKPSIIIGKRNKYDSRLINFFSTPDPVVIYKNENPYFQLISLENIVIQNPEKWYQKKITWFIFGAATLEILRQIIIKSIISESCQHSDTEIIIQAT